MKTILFSLLTAVAFGQLAAQGVGVSNQANKAPDPQAMLDVKSTTKGVLLPRLSDVQRTTLATSLTILQTGLEITDSATGRMYTWAGTKWTAYGSYTGTTPFNNALLGTNQVALNAGTAAGDLITWDGNNWVSKQPAPMHFSLSYNNLQPFLAINYCIALAGVFPPRNSDYPFVAEIQPFAFDFAPKNFASCNGQLISISFNTALFALLGTYYGGNGSTNFALPDLRGRIPINFGQGPGLSDYQLGENGGTETNYVNH